MRDMFFRNRKLAEKWLPAILMMVLYASGCAVVSFLAGIEENAPTKKAPEVVSVFNHLIHVEMGLECTDCHIGAEEESVAGVPDFEYCESCHVDELNDDYKWAQSEPRKDGVIVISRNKLKGFDDVIAPHNMHYYADLTCDTCHGDIAESEKIMENTIIGKEFCMDCHEGQLDCAGCHETIRKTTRPASHELRWLEDHGKIAFPDSGAKNKRCYLCHEETSCHKCHKKTRPSSHGESWERFHGSEVDMDFELQDNRCYFCHKQLECKTCHSTEAPSSHTASWTNRSHGLYAETERDSCLVCHNQAYCSHCHKAAPPRPRDAAHPANADCDSCHGLLGHGFRSTENFECVKCHK